MLLFAQPTSENYQLRQHSVGGGSQSLNATSSSYGTDLEAGGRYVYGAATTSGGGGGGGGGGDEESSPEEEPAPEEEPPGDSDDPVTEEEESEPAPGPVSELPPAGEPDGEEADSDAAGGDTGSSVNDPPDSEPEDASDDTTESGNTGNPTLQQMIERTISAVQSLADRLVRNAPQSLRAFGERVGVVAKQQLQALEPIQKTLKPLEVPVTYAGAGTGVVTTVATMSRIPFALSDLGRILAHGWANLFGLASSWRRRRPWGTVYDSVTKAPVDPAYVELVSRSGETQAEAITDLDGRYGFVAAPGIYTMKVRKTNYSFPSKRRPVFGKDVLYDHLYFGESFEMHGTVAYNIPLDPLEFDWNQFEKLRTNQTKFYHRLDPYIVRLMDVLFYAGAIVVIWQFFTTFEMLPAIFLIVYAILFLVRFFQGAPTLHGVLTRNGRPIPYAVVRIFRNGREFQSRVADSYGRYYAVVPPGNYTLRVDEQVALDVYETVYEGRVHTQNGVINGTIKIRQ